jgi:hypothetical protein
MCPVTHLAYMMLSAVVIGALVKLSTYRYIVHRMSYIGVLESTLHYKELKHKPVTE